jgi:hypothetical protein
LHRPRSVHDLLGPTVGSWFLFYVLLTSIGSLAPAVNFLIPPVSILLGALFHSEWDGVSLSDKLYEVGGMMVVLVGVALVLYAAHRQAREQARQGSAMRQEAENSKQSIRSNRSIPATISVQQASH